MPWKLLLGRVGGPADGVLQIYRRYRSHQLLSNCVALTLPVAANKSNHGSPISFFPKHIAHLQK